MAEINSRNFGDLCPLVKNTGFKVIRTTTEGGVYIHNEAWVANSTIDVAKKSTGRDKPIEYSPEMMASQAIVSVCAGICEYYDAGMELGWQEAVTKGMCVSDVVRGTNAATIKANLSS